jgi:hypothetical protein
LLALAETGLSVGSLAKVFEDEKFQRDHYGGRNETKKKKYQEDKGP